MPGMNDAEILDRLAALGLELPDPPAAVASYLPCVVQGSIAYVAGQVPIVDGSIVNPGVVGDRVSLDEAADAARLAALQALSALRDALRGSFDRVERIVKVMVFVAAVPGFVDHPKVANGASDLLAGVLGDGGRHARAAVGVTSLPLGACVEVVVTAAVRPE
jgi:enamine deaminase RidA (YjgF/YER057c/UK114 family)